MRFAERLLGPWDERHGRALGNLTSFSASLQLPSSLQHCPSVALLIFCALLRRAECLLPDGSAERERCVAIDRLLLGP